MARNVVAGLMTVIVLLACGSSSALAQGSEQEREACTPDALRLCGQFIPDEGRIEACLRNAGPRLSRACYIVFHPEARDAQPQPPGLRRLSPPAARPSDDSDWD